MRPHALLAAAVLLALPVSRALAASPAAAPKVDVALVLLDDVSGSINADEYALEKQGYLAAFQDPRVAQAIQSGPYGAVAVSFAEFAGAGQVSNVVGWTVLRDAAEARAFGARVHDAPRSAWGHTAIGDGIELALRDLAHSGVTAGRQVIDVAGDGTNNAGLPVREARDDAARQGVTINGLAIANESAVPWLQAHTHPPGGLDNYYRRNVATGEASFVMIVHDYHSFGDALVRKLVNEIASARARAATG